MSTQFPTKKFVHASTGHRLEGDVVLESSLSWQVAVGGKIRVLQKAEWSENRDGFTQGRPSGGFEDIFANFMGR